LKFIEGLSLEVIKNTPIHAPTGAGIASLKLIVFKLQLTNEVDGLT
jgi:hypothetical protein